MVFDVREEDQRVHPEYDAEAMDYDLRLMRLPRQIDVGKETPQGGGPIVDVVRLHRGGRLDSSSYSGRLSLVPGHDLRVIGYGRTSYGGDQSTSLEYASVSYVEPAECLQRYEGDYITGSMLCAFSDEGRDACQGDSGGPLIARGEDGGGTTAVKDQDMTDEDLFTDRRMRGMVRRTGSNPPRRRRTGKWSRSSHPHVLVGITSWGADCGHPKYPGVYSRVSTTYDWIERTVCNDLSPHSCDNKGRIRDFHQEREEEEEKKKKDSTPGRPGGKVKMPGGRISQVRSCTDRRSFPSSVGRKVKVLNCNWVNASKLFRCHQYADMCPKTCRDRRCRGVSWWD